MFLTIRSLRNLAAFVLLLSSASQHYGVGAQNVSVVNRTTGYFAVCGLKTSTSGNGCKKNRIASNPIVATTEVNATELHEVRCCSNTQPHANISNAVKPLGCAVWGFSSLNLTRDNCASNKTYADAESLCARNGGRLCTVQEILNGCTVGSGCGWENEHVWAQAIAPGPSGASYGPDYLGCYIDNNSRHLSFKVGSPYTVDGCSQICETAGYPFFGMKSGETCFCGKVNDELSKVPESNCTRPCIWGNGKCGGLSAVSVYKTDRLAGCNDFFYEDRYRMCVKDTDTHFEYKLTGTYSIKECYEACTDANFALAALAEGGKCWCGDEEPLEQAYNCNVPCKNGKGICGGNSTSRAVSMYRTDNVNKATIKTLLRCKGQLASWWGDPHMITFDNLKYNCQGIGHYTLIESQSQQYTLQGIFKRSTQYTSASVTHGIVAKYKNYPRVQVILRNATSISNLTTLFASNKCAAELYINGTLYNSSLASLALLNSTTGVAIKSTLVGYEVSFPPPGPAFTVKFDGSQGCFIDVNACLHQEAIGTPFKPLKVVGLLGTPNSDMTDEWMFRNSTKYSGSNDGTTYCNTVWCVPTASQSLFTYVPGSNFSTFDRCSNFTPSATPPPAPQASPEQIAACTILAKGNTVDFNNCIMETAGNVAPGAAGTVGEKLGNNLLISPDLMDTLPFVPPKNECCPDAVLLYHTDGVTPLADIGILHLVERFPNEGTVTLQWYNYTGVNPFRVYVEYENEGYANVCLNTTKSISRPFKIACPPNQMSAIVHVTVSDADSLKPGDKASLKECCHGKDDLNPKVKYTFVIPCEDPCPQSSAASRERRLRLESRKEWVVPLQTGFTR